MDLDVEANVLEASTLDTFAPLSDDFDLNSLQFSTGDSEGRDAGSLIPPDLQRSTLFYGML